VEVFRAIVLGVAQGLAEFLPISSSGHLRLLQDGLGWNEFGLAFDTLLHVGTLLAVVAYFRDDIRSLVAASFTREPARAHDRRLAWLIVVATVPTGVIGLIGADWFENAGLLLVGIAFLITAAALVVAELSSRRSVHDATGLGWHSALLVGVAQGVAVMPGISRSGATMASGLGLGLDREQAARFSFLLSGPIILLAALKQAADLIGGTAELPSTLAATAGFLAASVTGYIAIAGLIAYVRTRSFYPFAAYTALVGTAVVVWQVSAG